jgi:hypothetical protein
MSYDDQPLDHDASPERQQVSDAVASRVRIPAIFLIVVGVLNLLGAGWGIVNGIPAATDPQKAVQDGLDAEQQKMLKDAGFEPVQFVKSVGIGQIVVDGVGLLAAVVTILGGVRMLSLKNRGLAIFSSILAAIPCLSSMGCCGIGIGVGIWSLVVLMNADVKAAFRY